jgi:hypothetical protein
MILRNHINRLLADIEREYPDMSGEELLRTALEDVVECARDAGWQIVADGKPVATISIEAETTAEATSNQAD